MQQPANFDEARRSAIVNTLPPNARLLVQAGADDGALARGYREHYPSTTLVVVEGEAAAAQGATAYADRVLQASLDTAGAALYRHLQWADCWLFDQTLERLADPAAVLAGIRGALQYDACVLACVANPDHAQAARKHAWDAPALQSLFNGAGFRIASAIGISPGAAPAGQPAPPPSHYLIKAMPA